MLSEMRKLAIAAFVLLCGTPTVAFADRAPPRPEDYAPEADTKTDDKAVVDEKADVTKTDDKAVVDKQAGDKQAPAADDKKAGSCSVGQEDNAMLGVAAFVLLVSGLSLRKGR
jgi:hypothetical protein